MPAKKNKKTTPKAKKNNKKVKINTSVSLNQTKPAHKSKINRLKKSLSKSESNNKQATNQATEPNTKQSARQKPKSQLKEKSLIRLWLLPARVSFVLLGTHYLIFSLIVLAYIAGFTGLSPFFPLPEAITSTESFLLQTGASFGILTALLFFHAAQQPDRYKWFYFFLIIIFLPANFISNLQKMQLHLSLSFQNYLYFDTIALSIFWAISLLSLYSFLKLLRTESTKSIK